MFNFIEYPKATIYTLIASCCLLACSHSQPTNKAPGVKADRPNILLIVADDLGIMDIGAFGSEIKTPNIDRLAGQGLKLTNFHTSATCSPTRAMLLTGTDSHDAGLGTMAEHMTANQAGQTGYEGHLNKQVVTVASLLQDAGYMTYMAGKWHLGKTHEQLPVNRGFDESFVLLQGGASYFNDMMGLTAKVPGALYRHNDKTVTSLPDDFYASEYYADFIINQLTTQQSKEAPFFAYLSFSAPHWPLQVRDQHIDLYKGRYDEGYDALHAERINSAKELGLLPAAITPAARPAHIKPWSQLSPDEQKIQSKTMEIYAAVVERMDFHLGRVLDHLQDSGELDNTLIVFMSDNGADGSDRSKLPGNDQWLPAAWDLSFNNMGKKGSYVYPGAAWARASTGPYGMYKEFLSEGGILTPAIIAHPSVANKGSHSHTLVSVKDISPTILDYAGISHPGTRYKNRMIKAMSGVSLKTALAQQQFSLNEQQTKAIGWELFGQKAIRKGNWKLLWLSSKPKWLVSPANADQWALYNLANDPGETHDLSAQEPEKLQEMLNLWQQYKQQHHIVLPQY